MNGRRLALLDVALLALMILASRSALLLHEVAGHALPAKALGAPDLSMRLSVFGGGTLQSTPGWEPKGFGSFVFHLGGIFVNLATGAAAWFIARRVLKRRGLLHAFLLFLGAGSFGQAIFYLGNGFYYGEGDPEGFTALGLSLERLRWLWVAMVPAFGAAAALAARAWLDYLGGHAPVDTPGRRFGWTAATLGAVLAAYAGLWALTWNSEVDVTLSRRRLEREVARETVRRQTAPPPPVSATPSPPPAPVVTEAEVADRVPRPVASLAMLAAGLLGAALVLIRARPSTTPVDFPPASIALPTALAAVTVGIIILMGR